MKKSKLGYKRYSPDVNNPYNIIPSGRITMKDVDFPVYGVDDIGYAQIMYPGGEYQFPGNEVFEMPVAQFGMSTKKVDRFLNANKDLNWVQRLYEPNTPSIQIPGQQGLSTHFMESADGRVYPTVVQMPDGNLQYLGEDAYDYADETGEYIQFNNDRQARRFAKNYKKGTGVLDEFGSGGLKQWFDEKWVDVKTGKECGRSGKDKDGRPYPACRPSRRVNSTTPKTTSEMSSSEKAKFKREKTSGQRINYNHKRAQQGGEQDSTAENILEFLDPTGILSWDDASKAYNEWQKSGSSLPSFTQALDMFGAVPALGKFGKLKYLADPKAMKAVYKYFPWQQALNAVDTLEDETASKPAIPRFATEVNKKKKQGGQLSASARYQMGGSMTPQGLSPAFFTGMKDAAVNAFKAFMASPDASVPEQFEKVSAPVDWRKLSRPEQIKYGIDQVTGLEPEANRKSLENLLEATAYMENRYGEDPRAYGRKYTSSFMSIDPIALKDMFTGRGAEGRYNAAQQRQFENFKKLNLPTDQKEFNALLTQDNPVAAMAAARYRYALVPQALPDMNNPEAMFDYWLKNYNGNGVLKHQSRAQAFKDFQKAYQRALSND
jgi:hypothetical protein